MILTIQNHGRGYAVVLGVFWIVSGPLYRTKALSKGAQMCDLGSLGRFCIGKN